MTPLAPQENYIPANEAEVALARIQEDPAAFYNPTIQKGNQTFFMATPAGISMAPELSALFMIPTNILRRRRDGQESPSRKRARLGDAPLEDDEEIEAARREQRALSERIPADFQPEDITFDLGAGELDIHDEPMGFEDLGMAGDSSVRAPSMMKSPTPALARERLMSEARSLRAPSLAPSVMQSPDDCAIGFFDARTRVNGAPLTESQSQSQTAASQYYGEDEASQADARQRGFSQNTVKAVGFLRSEFSNEDGEIDEEKTVSFQEKAKKVSLHGLYLSKITD